MCFTGSKMMFTMFENREQPPMSQFCNVNENGVSSFPNQISMSLMNYCHYTALTVAFAKQDGLLMLISCVVLDFYWSLSYFS